MQQYILKPEKLFQNSLNGQIIFDDIYSNSKLPQEVIDDGLNDTYALLFPRIATLVCRIPEIIAEWESEAWAENYRRFDILKSELKQLIQSVDQLKNTTSSEAENKLNQIRMFLAQKLRIDLDLTGLRAERPITGKFDDFFIHPEINSYNEDKTVLININSPEESINNFINKQNKSIIIAPSGAGKSTLSKWLQLELLSPKYICFTVRLELRSLMRESKLTIYDIVKKTCGIHITEGLKIEHIDEWIKSKKIVFILDGFDEIKSVDRDYIFDWINDLSIIANKCPFILTSRKLSTDHLDKFDKDWTRWFIEPFDNNRIIEYIKKWYKYTPLLAENKRDIDAQELANVWKKDPTIEPFTGNPLLLSTLLMVHHLDGSLPNGRSKLYKRYIDGMLGIWDERRKLRTEENQLSLYDKKQILRNLALFMFFREEDQIEENIFINWLKSLLENMGLSISSEDVLAHLRERTGLIVGPGIYSFIHKTVAEYLVSEAILDGNVRLESGDKIDRFWLFQNRNNDRWNTIVFLWAGLAPISDIEDFIEQCLDIRDAFTGYGVLYDQIHRLSRNICRKFIFQYIDLIHDNFSSDFDSFYMIPGGYKKTIPLKEPGFQLEIFHILTVLLI